MPDDADELLAAALGGAQAIAANDPARIGEYLAEDWVIVSESGISPRERLLQLVASGELTHTAMDLASEARIRIFGDVGIVTARVTNTAYYNGERFDADEWTTDVLVRGNGRWRCVLSHITPARTDHASGR